MTVPSWFGTKLVVRAQKDCGRVSQRSSGQSRMYAVPFSKLCVQTRTPTFALRLVLLMWTGGSDRAKMRHCA